MRMSTWKDLQKATKHHEIKFFQIRPKKYKHFFSNRVIPKWNTSPIEGVNENYFMINDNYEDRSGEATIGNCEDENRNKRKEEKTWKKVQWK